MSGERPVLKVGSPLRGWCAPLEDSPDPVFRGRMLGDGVSIDPVSGELRAPFDAEVVTLPDSRHAVNLRAANGAEFLVHVGIDTVKLGGDGFRAHVKAGDRVTAGQLLLTFDMDTLARGAASLRTPVLLLQSDGFSVEAVRSGAMVDHGDVIFEVHGAAEKTAAGEAPEDGESLSRTVVTGLEHGIHARPAADLIESVASLDVRVQLEHGDQVAPLRSAVGLMSLGTHRGSRVTVRASGPDAAQALETIAAGLEPMPDSEAEQAEPAATTQASAAVPAAPEPGSVIRALPASPGLARGRTVLLTEHEHVPQAASGSPETERAALDGALSGVRDHLDSQAGNGDGAGAEIARAHRVILDDPMLEDRAVQGIAEGLSAAAAWRRSTEEAAAALSRLDDPRMRERVDDLHDIDLRVQRVLAGEAPGQGVDLPEGAIVVAGNLLPSQLLDMDRGRLAGICLAAGGATSHVAILAMSLRIPMLVAAGDGVLAIETGSELLLDADLGELLVRPGADEAERFSGRMEIEARRCAEEAAEALQPCLTADGVRIRVHANIGSAEDARAAVEAGAEGCGLLRTEFVFMERSRAPGADDQLQIYGEISAALGDRPLVIRTLDAGGDKPIPWLRQPPEENPALGIRGIRLGLAHPELFESQLRALLRLDHPKPVQVMVPMVSSVDEVDSVRESLDRLGRGTGAGLELGVMIETPAAAMIADRLAGRVDFFSVGTNDLAQYTLCMDRGEPSLARRLDALHPAVLQLIRRTVEAADGAGIPVAVCGGAAGDPLAAPVLLGLGVRELSMPASVIARQKALLRRLSIEQCERYAADALAQGSASAVRTMMRNFLTENDL